MSILRSHLVPGWPERAKWQRPARLRSSRTAGRAAGASPPLLSFLGRPHIDEKHLLLSSWHLFHTFLSEQLRSKAAASKPPPLPLPPPPPPPPPLLPPPPPPAAAASSRSKSSERTSSTKLCPKKKIPADACLGFVWFCSPLRTQSRRGAASLRQSSGSLVASGRVKNKLSAPVCDSLKGRRRIPQSGAATGGDMLWAPCVCVCVCAPLSMSLCSHCVCRSPPATRRRQTHGISGWHLHLCEPRALSPALLLTVFLLPSVKKHTY